VGQRDGAHRHAGLRAREPDRRERPSPARRVGVGDRVGDRLAGVDGGHLLAALSVGLGDGVAGGRLHEVEPRERVVVEQARGPEFPQGLPRGAGVAAAAGRQHDRVGGVRVGAARAGRERLADFERRGLLARDPERRVRVDELDRRVGVERVVVEPAVVARDPEDAGVVLRDGGEALGRDVVRNEHHAVGVGVGGVGRGADRHVAVRDRPDPRAVVRGGPRHPDRAPAVLEAPRRVLALVFQPEPTARVGVEAGRPDQRGVARAGGDALAALDRQQVGVAPRPAGSSGGAARRPLEAPGRVVGIEPERLAARTALSLGKRGGLAAAVAGEAGHSSIAPR